MSKLIESDVEDVVREAAHKSYVDGYANGYVEGHKNAFEGGRQILQPKWISVDEALPKEDKYVLIMARSIFDNSIQVARIVKGISKEQREKMKNGEIENPNVSCYDACGVQEVVPRSRIYQFGDEDGNNKVPYSWRANGGPMQWFGQEVSHWMPLPPLPEKEINSYESENN